MTTDLERSSAELEAYYDELYGPDWDCRWEGDEVVFSTRDEEDWVVAGVRALGLSLDLYPDYYEEDEDEEEEDDEVVVLGVDREERVLDHVWRRASQQ